MEAYADSVFRLDHIENKTRLVTTYIGSQGDKKAVTEYMRTLEKHSERAPALTGTDLLSDFKAGFKGL